MIENIRAIYENGVLRPLKRLDLPEDKIVEFDLRDVSSDNVEKPTTIQR